MSEGSNHGVVVTSALGVSSGSSTIGIVSISKVVFSLLELILFSLEVDLSGSKSEVEVREIDVALGDLSFLSGDLVFVGCSGGSTVDRGGLEVVLCFGQGIVGVVEEVVKEDENAVDSSFSVLGGEF